MASMNTRLNIEKLDGNIVQKHGGSKQVGFKQLGPGVETGVHGVHDEKRVWFEVELQGAQGDREAEVFQVSNDDTAVAQRRLIKGLHNNVRRSGLSKVFWAEDTTMSTYLVTRSPSSATGFKSPIDMLGFFGWLASIKQGMLEPVKVKCIFLGYRKGVVGNKALKVLQGDEFEVEPQNDHTFEVEPHGNVDHVVGSQEVQTQDLIYYQLARDREQHLACELFGYREDSNEAAFAVAAVEKLYAHESLTFNDTVACEVISKWKAGLKDDMDTQSDVYVLSNVGSQEYQMVCTRLDIASADVDQSQAAYMTLTGSWKKKIWLKGLMAESGYELSLVAGIVIGALVKGSSWFEVSA
ncbi:hypothetical protein Tco_1505981 [Tanacetum coccineum]